MGRDGKKFGGGGGRGGGGAGRGRKDKRGGHREGGGDRIYIENIDELMLREKGRLANSDDEEEERNLREGGDSSEEEQEQDGQEKQAKKEKPSVFAFAQKEQTAAADQTADSALSNAVEKLTVDGPVSEEHMTRKEKEALAKQRAKEDYERRHAAGLTDQAKTDMARLAAVRARREAASKQREAEGRAPGMSAFGLEDDEDLATKQSSLNNKSSSSATSAAKVAPVPVVPVEDPIVSAKRRAALAEDNGEEETAEDGGPPLLSSIEIKKLNGDGLKDHCKSRGLDIRGQKKDLLKRLLDHEAERQQKIAELKKK